MPTASVGRYVASAARPSPCTSLHRYQTRGAPLIEASSLFRQPEPPLIAGVVRRIFAILVDSQGYRSKASRKRGEVMTISCASISPVFRASLIRARNSIVRWSIRRIGKTLNRRTKRMTASRSPSVLELSIIGNLDRETQAACQTNQLPREAEVEVLGPSHVYAGPVHLRDAVLVTSLDVEPG